ncbi:hypothetical protein OSB04_018676 [Centaurea solstitialis]|uniref:Protein kinase domain-containing protein n=1 Tax=Centaurea solstitialis TaxID=347529 RepID=A0AA38WN77_9ASTR|nr:hypothetical protein OSB04_018676 [Centaurea solstitialis]
MYFSTALIFLLTVLDIKQQVEDNDEQNNSSSLDQQFVHKEDHVEKKDSSPSSSLEKHCLRFSLAELKLATHDFDDAFVIGKGGFGKVYKGRIEGGIDVAIKRLNIDSNQGATEFWAEIEMLSKLRHSHIVSLVGYHEESGKQEMILVYEYLPNGSLEDHLHKKRAHGGNFSPLTWIQRLRICLDAARGLDYLHTGTGVRRRVIHRDVKSSNILLDENWAGKIADFGLSRTGPAYQSCTTDVYTSQIRGTFGYMDAQYFATHILTRKSDVPAVDFTLDEKQHGLAAWAKHCVEGSQVESIKHGVYQAIHVLEISFTAFSYCMGCNIMDNLRLQSTTPRRMYFSTGLIVLLIVLDIIVYYLQKPQEEDDAEQNNSSSSDQPFVHKEDHVEKKDSSPSSSLDKQRRQLSLAEIKLATRDFDDAFVIGKGGFGNVYKGTIDFGGDIDVAIKRLKIDSNQGATEFWAEIEMLSKFRHSHIVSLLGYHENNSKREMILVYEYLPNGSLEDHLHKRRANGGNFSPLTWVQRLRICIDAARGLDYLHTGTGVKYRVIHCDVKSSNILLDENWAGKIADFGLSRTGPAHQSCTTNVYTKQIRGTFGYMDAQYFATHRLTRKSDVYSFGVVLFEVLCGRPALDFSLDEKQHSLAVWARHCVEEGTIHQFVDPCLRGEVSTHCVKKFAQIAYKCLLSNPKDRPTMTEVVAQLELLLALTLQNNSRVTLAEKARSLFTIKFPVPGNLKKKAIKREEQPTTVAEGGSKFSIPVVGNPKKQAAEDGSASDHHGGATRVFTKKELKMATNNYHVFRIIGIGGRGSVYIRNVVKLIGYCLETKFPLLVYEFISNGTLSDHIHNESRSLALTWDIRLRIATETAGALSYVHSAGSVPIIHGDIKPTNILVDDNYVAKVSDFRASNLIPMDQVELIRIVEGRLRYLDPEYLQTRRLTDKSDVYSLGVVLTELLTGKNRPRNERNLATYFLSYLKEGRLLQVLDERLLLNEGIIPNDIINVSRLAERCLRLKGDERPTMKEVAMELEGISSMKEKSVARVDERRKEEDRS